MGSDFSHLPIISDESTGEDVLVLPPPESDLAWCCLYTRPRHEKCLARTCRAEGIIYHLPLRRVIRHYRSRKEERWLPFFPGYLFCCPNPLQRHEIRGEENLLSVLDVYDQEKLLGQLREIRKALSVSDDLETVPYLAAGKRVRIARGPFRGIEGIVKETTKRHLRVLLNVTLLNAAARLEVDAGDVEPGT